MDDPTPLVSIVIPCFNAASYLAEAVRSCMHQSYPSIECLIVDDGSTDNTLEIADALTRQTPDRVRLFRKANGGAASARNYGMRQSRAEYLLFLDSDDLLLPSAVESLVAACITSNSTFAFGQWINFFPHSEHEEIVEPSSGSSDDLIASLITNPPVVSAFLTRCTTQQWQEGMVINEVIDYVFRYLASNPEVAFVKHPITKIRQRTEPDRITIRHDHFEPVQQIQLYSQFKVLFDKAGVLTPERGNAFDQQILSSAYRARCRGDRRYRMAAHTLDIQRLPQHRGYRPFKLAGFVHLLGIELGIELFFQINRMLGRN